MARSSSSNSKKAAMKKQPVEEEESSTSSSAVEEEDQVMAEDSEGESSGSDDDDMSDEGSGSEQSEDDDAVSGSEEEDGDEHLQDTANNDNVSSDVNNNTEHCTFDLNNLLAFNTHQINAAELYQKQKGKSNKLNQEWYSHPPTISSAASTQILPAVNEALLLSKAAEGTTQLLQELWKLPTEKTDVGPMAKLPLGGETKLPRSLVSIYYYIICIVCNGINKSRAYHIMYTTISSSTTYHAYHNIHQTQQIFLATSTTQTINKMGTICTAAWYSTKV